MEPIEFGWQPGATLTYQHYRNKVEVTIGATSLPEIDDGYYRVDNVPLVRGDVVIVKESTVVVGFGVNDPEGLQRYTDR